MPFPFRLLIGLLLLALPAQAQRKAPAFVGSPLPKGVNSNADEFAPLLSQNGRRLFFVRAAHPGNKGGSEQGHDLWMSLSKRGRWGTAENLGYPVNNGGENGLAGIGDDGQTVYLTSLYNREGLAVGPGISKSTRQGNAWSMPETVWDPKGRIMGKTFGGYMDPGGQVAILAMEDSAGGQGGTDLYALCWTPQGWAEPVSLGPAVNSAGHDFAPFLSPDGRRLFFSSMGHEGLGSADIFVAQRLGEGWTQWTAPINLGPAVNTPDFDAYFSTDTSGTVAYFSSAPGADALGDLYQAPIASIPALSDSLPALLADTALLAAETPAPLDTAVAEMPLAADTAEVAQAIETVAEEAPTTAVPTETAETGQGVSGETAPEATAPISEVPVEEEVGKDVSPISETTPVPVEETPPPYEEIYEEVANRTDATFENILFGFNEYRLSEAERRKAKHLADFLREHPEAGIRLNGHTDQAGSDSINVIFGNARCESIRRYLVGQGIASARIFTYSYGEKEPLPGQDDILQRRVEIFVTKPEEEGRP
jgi:outer membrane protein OmpA-like peptidoglycan-associated protein